MSARVTVVAADTPSRPAWTPPPGAVDAHVHVFGPEAQFPVQRQGQISAPGRDPGDAVRAARPAGLRAQRHRPGELPRHRQRRDARRHRPVERHRARRRGRRSGDRRRRAWRAARRRHSRRPLQFPQAPGRQCAQGHVPRAGARGSPRWAGTSSSISRRTCWPSCARSSPRSRRSSSSTTWAGPTSAQGPDGRRHAARSSRCSTPQPTSGSKMSGADRLSVDGRAVRRLRPRRRARWSRAIPTACCGAPIGRIPTWRRNIPDDGALVDVCPAHRADGGAAARAARRQPGAAVLAGRDGDLTRRVTTADRTRPVLRYHTGSLDGSSRGRNLNRSGASVPSGADVRRAYFRRANGALPHRAGDRRLRGALEHRGHGAPCARHGSRTVRAPRPLDGRARRARSRPAALPPALRG